MLKTTLQKVFGTKHDRDIKMLQPIVDKINALEPSLRVLSDQSLREKTDEFKAHFAKTKTDQDRKNTLDKLLPEAFAVCREAGRRVLSMRIFDVQLIGGIVLH